MAVYSIKNISASAVVWSSQTIQPNEAIDINYENLYDKTTDLGISQDAINVSTLAQEDKILLCIDDVASTKAETLEFIRELHNKNNVLEIPTKFLPSKHLYNWEKVGNKLSYLGGVDVDGNLNLGAITNESPNTGDIWRDSNNVIKAVTEEGDAHDLWVGLGHVNGTDSHTAMTDADSLTINKFYRTGSTWTGSPIAGTSGNNQGFLLHTGSSALYGTQTFFSSNSWVHGETWTRTKSNGTWTPWIKSASTGVNNNFSVDQTFHGKVGIGTNNPIEKFFINSDSGDARMGLNAPTGSDTEIKFFNNGSVEYTIGHDDGTNNFVIGTANVDAPLLSINKTGNVDIGGKTKIVQNGTALELHGSDHTYISFFPKGGSREAYFGFPAPNTDNMILMNQNASGNLAFGTGGSPRLTIGSDGNVDIGGHNVVTESPYFTDGWVSVPSSWIHSGITVTESFQYRVNEVGAIEFSGRGQNNTNTSSRAFTIFNANAIPTALRPSKLQRGALACEVGGVTRTNYYYMATTGQLSIYKDVTVSGGTFSANECKVSITTLNYQIQG